MPTPRPVLARAVAIGGAAAAVAAAARPATAQMRVELTPFVGSFVPLADWGSVDGRTATSTFRQTTGVALGARLGFGFTDQLGAEIAGAIANSGWIESRDARPGQPASTFDNIGLSLTGRVTTVDARLTWRPRRANWYGIAGAGWATRGGRAWEPTRWNPNRPPTYNTSNVAGLLGAGLRAQASPTFGLDVNAIVYLSGTQRVARDFAYAGTTFTQGGTQADLVVTFGVPIRLTGR